MKESYENIKLLLSKIQYSTYVWKICVGSNATWSTVQMDLQSIFVLCVNGTAETGLIITSC